MLSDLIRKNPLDVVANEKAAKVAKRGQADAVSKPTFASFAAKAFASPPGENSSIDVQRWERWCVGADARSRLVATLPAITIAEMRERYSGEKFWPLSPQEWAAFPAPDRSCQSCHHFSRPGLSEGYCAGRDDLPHAYGAGHPLRKLPSDSGLSCEAWALSR
jgi:hypothetical protein